VRYISISIFVLALIPYKLSGQIDTINPKVLEKIIVKSYRFDQPVSTLPDVHCSFLIGGRKSEVLQIQELPANLAEKTGRQLFAKIPGAFIYDMDGSGNQINISTRGLDAHRSWEFNVRQNGIITNSDIYGYPASHYSMPMEAIEQIELVRGTASLQYGAEFGGMINYKIKSPDTSKTVSFETINTAGSYGLLSSYNALGGKIGKLTYYAYYHQRVSDGYRKHADSKSEAQFISLNYKLSSKWNARLELGRSKYLYQIPGPLTDSMFYADPRQSTRRRNFYSPDIYVPSLQFEYRLSNQTSIQWTLSGIFGTRSSVEFEGFAHVPDVIDPVTLEYKNRTVNIDRFNSKISEWRLIHQFQTGSIQHILSAGLTYFNNDMHRRQQGKGTTGTDYDLTILGPWGRDLYYRSESIAASVENMVQLTPQWSITPGFRYEYGDTKMSGRISYLDPADIPNHILHRIPVFGINTQYKWKNGTRVYAGISQSYRPVLFKDIVPGSTLERANKDLEDAYGHNMEAGLQGRFKSWLKYDLSIFAIRYNNRLGNQVLQDGDISYIYKTNIGDSKTHGLEVFSEAILLQTRTTYFSFFTSTSWMKGIYNNVSLASGGQNFDVSGHEVESVPRWISRNGFNFGYKTFRLSLLYSFVDKTFSDPANTITPTPDGAKGIVPAYGIWDVNISVRSSDLFIFRAGINNLFDKQYFTKRPLFYPGPGIWSSDGRSLVVSVGIKI
jgi:Fe(3+) dicitrate transport protein